MNLRAVGFTPIDFNQLSYAELYLRLCIYVDGMRDGK